MIAFVLAQMAPEMSWRTPEAVMAILGIILGFVVVVMWGAIDVMAALPS